jgi:hypothetical protein
MEIELGAAADIRKSGISGTDRHRVVDQGAGVEVAIGVAQLAGGFGDR